MAATSFADELHKWHKQLQTIEAVLVVWLKVQQLWVQLEEVCMVSLSRAMSCKLCVYCPPINFLCMQVYQSSDLQQHLSSYAFSFANADREFKDLMSLTAKNPAVLAVCLKDSESLN